MPQFCLGIGAFFAALLIYQAVDPQGAPCRAAGGQYYLIGGICRYTITYDAPVNTVQR